MNQPKTIGQSKVAITIYRKNCKFCKQTITETTEKKFHKSYKDHLENKCATLKTMEGWEKQGIYKEMAQYYRLEGLHDELQKLLKEYTIQEIRNELEGMEREK